MKRAALLFVLALLLRLSFLGIWHAAGQGSRISGDGTDYYRIAVNVAEGRGFQLTAGEPTGRRPPLYPTLIAATIKTDMSFPLAVQILQCGFGALTALFLYLLGKNIFDESAGVWTALLLIFDYLSIRETASVMSETLFVFLLTLSFFLLYEAFSKNKVGFLFGSGVLAGFSLLTRDVALFFYPFVGAWLFFFPKEKGKAVSKAAIYCIALGLTIGPWMMRNTLLFKKPSLITTTAGHTFYLANNQNATGGRTGGDWETTDTRYPDMNLHPPLYTPQADRYLFKEAWNFIAANPKQFLRLTGRKILNTWRPYQTDAPLWSRLIQGISYCVVMLLAVLGLWKTRQRWRELLPLYAWFGYIFLLHAVLISGIRYRFPAMPFLMLFAGFALSRIPLFSQLFNRSNSFISK